MNLLKRFRGHSYHRDYPHLKWNKAAVFLTHIPFLCFRHTYATLLLELGTDIYLLSKERSHYDIKTTEINAKIVDRRKQDSD